LESANVNEYFSEITSNFVLRKIFPVSVVVVSSSVYNQWLNELTHSKLKYRIVYKAIDLKDIDKWIFNVDVIVVTYAKYNDFSILLRNIIRFRHNVDIVVKRLIFDELQLTGKMGKLTADFYWIVSATFKYNKCYRYHSRDLRTNFMCVLLNSIVTRYVNIFNSDEDIELSYKQADVIEKVYNCYIKHFNTLLNYLPNEVQRMIAADDITGAIVSLGGTKDGDIVNAVITKETRKIEEIKASIVYHTQLNNNDKVKEQEDKLYKAENSLKFLKEKLENDDSNDCPICYEEFTKKILTNCCKYLICDKCITKTLKDAKTCPFCRQKLDLSDMIVSECNSSSDSLNESNKTTKGKLETLVEIIKNNPNGKFIVFSEFEKTFFPIKETLMNNGILYSEVKGTADSKQKSIRLFKEGKIQVLFLNARNDGTGINLPEATDLILYHKLSSPALENQVFGRALRLGRTENLIVHRLLTPEEQNINNVNQNIDYSQSQQVAIENIERERLRQEREDYELALSLQNNL
jgi:SNF2 family DNA or RNA helicase